MKRSKFIWTNKISNISKDKSYLNEININNFVSSGYGDRMLGLFLISILSKLKNKNINIKWIEFKKPHHTKDFPHWRYKDTNLENFISFFKLPSTISLKYELDPIHLHCTKDLFTIPCSPASFYDKFKLQDLVSQQEYNSIINTVKSEFGFNVSKFSYNEPYVTIHLRRTDKLCVNDEYSIDCSELELNNETKRAIRKAIDKKYTTFYLSSDDPSCKQEFIDFIINNNGKVIKPENIHNLIESYYDTWVMSSSSIIIPSINYSSFSLFPVLLFDIEMWTVLESSTYKNIGFCEHARIINYKNV